VFSDTARSGPLAWRLAENRVPAQRHATIWNELFPVEQARVVQLLVERVDIQGTSLEVRIRAEGLSSLVAELRQCDERRAA
jgi:site-specific DNA recombinase